MDIRDHNGRKTNICGTKLVGEIHLYHNKYGSGEYFAEFIEWTGSDKDGYWRDALIDEETVKKFLKICRKNEM